MKRMRSASFALGLILTSQVPPVFAASPCDLNLDNVVSSADIQAAVNMSLGLTSCTANIIGAGVCNAVVVQRVVNASAGGACITGSLRAVTLNWTASTSTVSGYNVYRGTVSGGPYTKVNSSVVAGTTFTDNVVGGQTYYYVATAVDASQNESVYSNIATAVVPSP